MKAFDIQPPQARPTMSKGQTKLGAPKAPIPKQNVLDLRQTSPQTTAKPARNSLRQYYPLTPRHPKAETPVIQEQIRNEVASPASAKKRISIRTIILAALTTLAIIVAAGGFLTPLLENPQIVAALYIPVALVLKLKSKTTFSIALFLLLTIPLLLLLGQQALAETYAIFCFNFLVIGVVMAMFELRSPARKFKAEKM